MNRYRFLVFLLEFGLIGCIFVFVLTPHVNQNAIRENQPAINTIASLFNEDSPVPPERLKAFQCWSQNDADCKCNGYCVAVNSVTPSENGFDIEITVRPELISLTGGVPFTTHTVTEKWHVSKQGILAFQKIVKDSPGVLIFD